jgi:hypothetical protein
MKERFQPVPIVATREGAYQGPKRARQKMLKMKSGLDELLKTNVLQKCSG